MDLLYLAHRIPYPPNKGDKLRAFRQIEHLARRHRVWCACFVDEPADQRFVAPLSQFCHRLAAIPLNRSLALFRGLAGLASGGSVTSSFYRHPKMKSTIEGWSNSQRFDVVFAFSSGMAPHALRVPAPKRVLDLCDLDSEKWRAYAVDSPPPWRWAYSFEARRLALAEQAWVDAFDEVLLITEAEAAALRNKFVDNCDIPSEKPSHFVARNIHVVGNGARLPALGSKSFPIHSSETIGFVGVMNYRPNVDAVRWFVERCWSQIRNAYPHARFRIVGRSPTRVVRRLGSVPGVEVVGEVETVEDEVMAFDVSIAPLRIARGLQNKVLEAMAAAKPVVLTPNAARGLGGSDGAHYWIAETPNDFTADVLRLLADPRERQRIGRAARQYVAEHFRWDAEMKKLDAVFMDAMDRAELNNGPITPYDGSREEAVRPALTTVRTQLRPVS